MIYTSYYANRKISNYNNRVAISIYPPKWLNGIAYDKSLAPTNKILKDYKAEPNIDRYIEEFDKSVLSKLDFKVISEKHNSKILLCYEKPDDFCHRQLIAKWLTKNGKLTIEWYPTLKVAVVGSRSINDYEKVKGILDNFFNRIDNNQEVIINSGGAKGVDSLARRYAEERDYKIIEIKPDWSIGKSAGFKRDIVINENSQVILAIWDGQSKGTINHINLSKRNGNVLIVYNLKDNTEKIYDFRKIKKKGYVD